MLCALRSREVRARLCPHACPLPRPLVLEQTGGNRLSVDEKGRSGLISVSSLFKLGMPHPILTSSLPAGPVCFNKPLFLPVRLLRGLRRVLLQKTAWRGPSEGGLCDQHAPRPGRKLTAVWKWRFCRLPPQVPSERQPRDGCCSEPTTVPCERISQESHHVLRSPCAPGLPTLLLSKRGKAFGSWCLWKAGSAPRPPSRAPLPCGAPRLLLLGWPAHVFLTL